MKKKFTLEMFRAANTTIRGTPCTLAAFLKRLPSADVATVVKAFADRTIQASAIHAVLKQHGFARNAQVIARHRNRTCQQCVPLGLKGP